MTDEEKTAARARIDILDQQIAELENQREDEYLKLYDTPIDPRFSPLFRRMADSFLKTNALLDVIKEPASGARIGNTIKIKLPNDYTIGRGT